MPDIEAGTSYGQLILDQLNEERNRKTSLESRGITVITTSGTLATLLFALTAGLTAAAGFKLPGAAKLPLLLALVAFVLAAIFGLATNLPIRYREATPSGLARLVDARYWSAPPEIGQLRVAAAQVAIVAATRSGNNLKVIFLIIAIFAELLAAVFLSWGVVAILYGP